MRDTGWLGIDSEVDDGKRHTMRAHISHIANQKDYTHKTKLQEQRKPETTVTTRVTRVGPIYLTKRPQNRPSESVRPGLLATCEKVSTSPYSDGKRVRCMAIEKVNCHCHIFPRRGLNSNQGTNKNAVRLYSAPRGALTYVGLILIFHRKASLCQGFRHCEFV